MNNTPVFGAITTKFQTARSTITPALAIRYTEDNTRLCIESQHAMLRGMGVAPESLHSK